MRNVAVVEKKKNNNNFLYNLSPPHFPHPLLRHINVYAYHAPKNVNSVQNKHKTNLRHIT